MTIPNIWQIFGLTLFASFTIAAPDLEARIVGGYVAEIKEVPFIVALLKPYQFCGGSLIAKRYILTAAHCTAGKNATNPGFEARLGSKDSERGGLVLKAIEIFQHSGYDFKTVAFDFSIVKLDDYKESSLPFKIQYAELPLTEENIEDGTELTAAGWGTTHNFLDSRTVLRAVRVFTVNRGVCEHSYKKFRNITDQMICAGVREGGKDACQGDSGGPLFRENLIWGIVSWGNGCGMRDYPGIYSRVASVRNWILEIIKDE